MHLAHVQLVDFCVDEQQIMFVIRVGVQVELFDVAHESRFYFCQLVQLRIRAKVSGTQDCQWEGDVWREDNVLFGVIRVAED